MPSLLVLACPILAASRRVRGQPSHYLRGRDQSPHRLIFLPAIPSHPQVHTPGRALLRGSRTYYKNHCFVHQERLPACTHSVLDKEKQVELRKRNCARWSVGYHDRGLGPALSCTFRLLTSETPGTPEKDSIRDLTVLVTLSNSSGSSTPKILKTQNCLIGTSLAVQRLRLCTSNAGGTDSIPGRGTKIPHAARHSQENIFFLKNCIIYKMIISSFTTEK